MENRRRPTNLVKEAESCLGRHDNAGAARAVEEILDANAPSVVWLPIAERCVRIVARRLCAPPDAPVIGESRAVPPSTEPAEDYSNLLQRAERFREECRAAFDAEVEQMTKALRSQQPKSDALRALARLCVAKRKFESAKSRVTFMVHGGSILDWVETDGCDASISDPVGHGGGLQP